MLALLWSTALAASTLVRVEGLDDCCAPQVAAALGAVAGVSGAGVDHAAGVACVTGSPDPEALRAAVVATGFVVTAVEPVDACPDGARPKGRDPWEGLAGVDAQVVSRGEDLALAPVPGRFAVYDFGAPWCGPCFDVVKVLHAYLQGHPDTAVRAVWLDAADPVASFALPAAKRHLAFAEAIPYFVVLDPKGRVLYRGVSVADALASIDRKRK